MPRVVRAARRFLIIVPLLLLPFFLLIFPHMYSGLENRCKATVFEHTVDVTLQGVEMALSACRER